MIDDIDIGYINWCVNIYIRNQFIFDCVFSISCRDPLVDGKNNLSCSTGFRCSAEGSRHETTQRLQQWPHPRVIKSLLLWGEMSFLLGENC